jgi:hypothetical protein
MTKDNMWCIVLGFLIFSILNTMPFADAEKYRRAKQECEKSLPRDQQCKIIGVPE